MGARKLALIVLVTRHFGVNLTGPLVYPPCKIQYPLKSTILQELNSKCAPIAMMAVHHNFAALVKLVELRLELTQRQEVSIEIGDVELIRFAHIEKENLLSPFQAVFQMLNRNF